MPPSATVSPQRLSVASSQAASDALATSVAAPSPEVAEVIENSQKEATTEKNVVITTDSSFLQTDNEVPMPGLKSLSSDAMLRGFYVFVGVGVIILVYILIKMTRLRRRRQAGKYRMLPQRGDTQEMFPLAADDEDDEEIFNAADHTHS